MSLGSWQGSAGPFPQIRLVAGDPSFLPQRCQDRSVEASPSAAELHKRAAGQQRALLPTQRCPRLLRLGARATSGSEVSAVLASALSQDLLAPLRSCHPLLAPRPPVMR